MKPADERLLEFLDTLPTTIRSNVVYLCCHHVEAWDELVELATIDAMDLLRRFFDVDGTFRASRCAQLVGVVEMVLQSSPATAKDNQALYEETGAEVFRDIALRAPLYEKHLEQARERFSELRQGILSAQALAIWKSLLSAEHPWIQESE